MDPSVSCPDLSVLLDGLGVELLCHDGNTSRDYVRRGPWPALLLYYCEHQTRLQCRRRSSAEPTPRCDIGEVTVDACRRVTRWWQTTSLLVMHHRSSQWRLEVTTNVKGLLDELCWEHQFVFFPLYLKCVCLLDAIFFVIIRIVYSFSTTGSKGRQPQKLWY